MYSFVATTLTCISFTVYLDASLQTFSHKSANEIPVILITYNIDILLVRTPAPMKKIHVLNNSQAN